MRCLLACIIGVALPLLACAPPACAAEKAKAAPQPAAPQSPSASIRPVYAPNGTFFFCLADHSYPDGRKMTIALSPQNQINIGVTIPQGHFRTGGKYDLSLALNAEPGRKVRAESIDEETLLLQMGANPAFRKKLAASQTLSVSANDRVMTFELPSMPALLSGLQTCIKDKADTKDERAAKAESLMPEMLKALLITAGFTDIVPLPTDHIPENERPADFIWRTGNLMAGIRERAVPTDKTLTDMIGLHMQGLKKQCAGAFKAEIGKEQVIEGLHLRLAEASCTPKEDTGRKPVTVAIVFYLTKTGGFTVFTHEAASTYKDEALAARDKLAKALLSLAKG